MDIYLIKKIEVIGPNDVHEKVSGNNSESIDENSEPMAKLRRKPRSPVIAAGKPLT